MTIDETIKYAEEIAKEKEERAWETQSSEEYMTCKEYVDKYRQLTEWLKELKQLREQTKWIPCSKQLPKENKYYLVQNEYGDMLVARYIKKEDCWEEIYSWHKLGAFDDIIAWMPLPKKYKTEMENKK